MLAFILTLKILALKTKKNYILKSIVHLKNDILFDKSSLQTLTPNHDGN